MIRSGAVVLMGVVGAGLALGAFAQPGDRSLPPPPLEEPDEASIRANIVRRLEFARRRMEALQREEARLNEAIARLDRGDSPQDVMGSVREAPGRFDGERRGNDDPLRGPDRGGPGGDRERGGERPSPERLLAALAEVAPDLGRRLEALRAQSPEQADRLLGRLGPRLYQILDLRSRDPDLAGLKVQELQAMHGLWLASMAMREARAAEPVDAAAEASAKERMRAAIEQSFDVNLAIQRHDLARFTERLEELHEEIARRQAQREQIVEQQFEMLTRPGAPEGGAERDGRGRPDRRGG
ncbi:MAG: hypothetical protein H6811_11890 [Phycisphaeraceae bacterium]|nr:hypothetical protein [Phycisphaeraceae bacterium]